MNKISVGKTIAHAYRFTFSELGSIIGVAWISLVAIAVLQFLPFIAGGDPMAASPNPIQAGQQAIQGLGIGILEILLYSIVYVALMRLALGQKPGGAIAHFALGAPEFRMFGAMLLLIVVFVGLGLGAVIVGAICGGLLALLHNQPIEVLTGAVLIIALFCALIYAIVRLSFLLVPVTVAEDHISLSRGWVLTAGNFWRIFVVLLAITLPLVAINTIGTAIIAGPGLLAPLPSDMNAWAQAITARVRELNHHAPALIGLRLLIAPFQLGLSMGAAAFAYRALAIPKQAELDR